MTTDRISARAFKGRLITVVQDIKKNLDPTQSKMAPLKFSMGEASRWREGLSTALSCTQYRDKAITRHCVLISVHAQTETEAESLKK